MPTLEALKLPPSTLQKFKKKEMAINKEPEDVAPTREKPKKVNDFGLSTTLERNIPLHLQPKLVTEENKKFQKIKNGAPVRFRDVIADSSK